MIKRVLTFQLYSKLTRNFIVFTFILFSLYCNSQENYSKRDFKYQIIPDWLTECTWILDSIGNEKVDSCELKIKFENEGQLTTIFKNHEFKGKYLIDKELFKYLNCGWNPKVVWTSDTECNVNPMILSYSFNGENITFKQINNKLIINSKVDKNLIFNRNK